MWLGLGFLRGRREGEGIGGDVLATRLESGKFLTFGRGLTIKMKEMLAMEKKAGDESSFFFGGYSKLPRRHYCLPSDLSHVPPFQGPFQGAFPASRLSPTWRFFARSIFGIRSVNPLQHAFMCPRTAFSAETNDL